MMMRVSGLGNESFDKYKANKDYFKDVDEFMSDSKASIQQFANYLEAVNNKIKTSPLEKRYLTDDGKSLGADNEMMTEVSSMIQTTRIEVNYRGEKNNTNDKVFLLDQTEAEKYLNISVFSESVLMI